LQQCSNLINALFCFPRYAIKATTTKVAILSRLLPKMSVCDYQTETWRRNNQVICFDNIKTQINLRRNES